MLEGPGLDSRVDKVLQKKVEMIKILSHQINEHYIDLSKRLKMVEERVINAVEEAVAKVVQPLKEKL